MMGSPACSAATRYLVAAEHAGLPIIVVLNKSDLVDQGDVEKEIERINAWGYDCIPISVKKSKGLDLLEDRLKGDVTVVAGPSGAGKSSIINALSLRSLDEKNDTEDLDLQAVGNVSERIGRGKHTTRNVTIIQMSQGGALVDTPGFNQPTLNFPPHDLERCFPEIRTILSSNDTGCAFKNCKHISEPGCIVRGDWERYESYTEILHDLEELEQIQAKRAISKRRREGNVRHKRAAGGALREEARLDTKSHRRTSRRSVKQEISEIARSPLFDDIE
mmetsp:Transcript_9250/g.18355  ORF Transcript_9250/g.18355 Transcript_9250/m.18355 type:complete len:276 (+) Transcript_9250:1322-2149(+)